MAIAVTVVSEGVQIGGVKVLKIGVRDGFGRCSVGWWIRSRSETRG